MLNIIRKRAKSAAILAVLIIVSVVAGCGDGSTDRTAGKVARKTAPSLSNQPPVSSAPKAVPVDEQVAVKKEEPKKPELPKTVAYEDAEAAYNNRQYATAVQLFTIYTANKDQNPWGFYMLGLSAWKAGDNEYAEEAFEKSLALAPGHVKSLLNLSRVLPRHGPPVRGARQDRRSDRHRSGFERRLPPQGQGARPARPRGRGDRVLP